MTFKTYQEFFSHHKKYDLSINNDGPMLNVEELYQHFKARMLEEVSRSLYESIKAIMLEEMITSSGIAIGEGIYNLERTGSKESEFHPSGPIQPSFINKSEITRPFVDSEFKFFVTGQL